MAQTKKKNQGHTPRMATALVAMLLLASACTASSTERQVEEVSQPTEQAEQGTENTAANVEANPAQQSQENSATTQKELSELQKANIRPVPVPTRQPPLVFEQEPRLETEEIDRTAGANTDLPTAAAEARKETRRKNATAPPNPARELTAEEWEEILSLVPENPRLTESPGLHEIYELNPDFLQQFELEPRLPIESGRRQDGNERINSAPPLLSDTPFYMNYQVAKNHPYLHLFPTLAYTVKAAGDPNSGSSKRIDRATGEEIFLYDYFPEDRGDRATAGFQRRGRGDLSYQPYHGIEHFLLNPWFETVTTNEVANLQNASDFNKKYYPNRRRGIPGPHWFGNNSLRGELLSTVEKLITQAHLPGVEPYQMGLDGRGLTEKEAEAYDAYKRQERQSRDLREIYDTRKMRNYLATPIMHLGPEPDEIEQHFRDNNEAAKAFQVPSVRWELVSNTFPIVKVTVEYNALLPLKPNPAPEGWPDRRPRKTRYAVAFVIAFQNRWHSFENEERWIRRFLPTLARNDTIHYGERGTGHIEDQLPFDGRRGAIDPDRGILPPSFHNRHWPNYWHHTDYMHHSIIGPVAMRVYDSPVLKPGLYWQEPERKTWHAPDYVIPPELYYRHFTSPEGTIGDGEEAWLTPEVQRDPSWAIMGDHYSANAGFPLPGHVMTNNLTQPGTDYWLKHDLSQNNW